MYWRKVEEPKNLYVIPKENLPALKFGVYRVRKIVSVDCSIDNSRSVVENYFFLDVDGHIKNVAFNKEDFNICTELFPICGMYPEVGKRFRALIYDSRFVDTSPVVELRSALGCDGKESFVFRTLSGHFYFGTSAESKIPKGAC